jgi:PBSX family phage portal protein
MPIKDPEQKKAYDREYQRQRRAEKRQSQPLPQPSRPATKQPFGYVTQEGRVVRKDIMEQYAFKGAEERSTQIKADRFMGAYKSSGLIQPLYNPETLASITEINAYHFRACQVKARDTAGLGWDLIPLVDDPDPDIKQEIEDFFNSQDRPLTMIFYRHQYDVEVVGQGGLEVVREGYSPDGRPKIIAHVPGHTLRIHDSENKYAQKRGNKTRWFKKMNYEKDVDKDTGSEHELNSLPPERRAAELIWNSLYTQRSDYYGIPDIVPALGAVHGDLARRDYNIAFFDNFGVPAYAVFITGDYDPGDRDEDGRTELENTIEKHFKALANNPHATLVLAVPTMEGTSGGKVEVEFQPLAVDIKDASFRLYRKDNRDEIISAHGVPPYRLGIVEIGSLGGSTAEESTEIYKASVINPRQETIEAMINQYILWDEHGFDTKDWEFKFREIDTADEKHDLDMIKELFDMGALRIRDVIRLMGPKYGIEDDPDDPRLDQRFIGGQPLTQEMPADQVEKVLKDLQEKIIKVAVKDARSADQNSDRDRTVLTLLDGFKINK